MTKLLLSASAIVMAIAGLAGTFMPHELLARIGASTAGALPLIVQILAAMYLGFAMMNWMARGSLFGGIYNRPLALGNLVHFVVGALALVKAVQHGERGELVIVATIVYAIFAIAFGFAMMRSPVKSESPRPT